MNKTTGYVLRIVLGGYLIWLGISILIQVLDERPSNTEFICAAAVVFIAVGVVYAAYSLIKLVSMKIKLRKKPVSEDEYTDENAEGVPSVQVQSEKHTDKAARPGIKVQADTVEFKKINEAPEAKPEKDTQPEKAEIAELSDKEELREAEETESDYEEK